MVGASPTLDEPFICLADPFLFQAGALRPASSTRAPGRRGALQPQCGAVLLSMCRARTVGPGAPKIVGLNEGTSQNAKTDTCVLCLSVRQGKALLIVSLSQKNYQSVWKGGLCGAFLLQI